MAPAFAQRKARKIRDSYSGEYRTGAGLAAPRLHLLIVGTEESNMQCYCCGAVPAVIVVGGVGYYLGRAVH